MANLTALIDGAGRVEAKPESKAASQLEVFVIAALLPTAMSIVDMNVLERLTHEQWEGLPVLLTYAMFVVQIALVSFLVGTRLNRGLIKWVVFLWAIMLIDLLLFAITAVDMYEASPAVCLALAFMSGQVGLLTVWGTLARVFWALRLPVAGTGLAVVIYFASRFGGGSDLWFAILCWQSLSIAILCAVLWMFGFRLRPAELNSASTRRLQFSVRHLFAWTTTVACMVGVARVLDWTSFLLLGRDSMLPCVGLGGCFAIVSIVAVWASLGAESFWVRIVGLAVSTPVIALAIGAVGLTRLPGWVTDRLFLGRVYDPMLWLTWITLATFFLAALLIVFRASGHRLQRSAAA